MTEMKSLFVDSPYMGNITSEIMEKNFPIAVFPEKGFAVGFVRNLEIGRMFAAAPELLDALEDAVRYAQVGDVMSAKAIERARAAIAKAKGE